MMDKMEFMVKPEVDTIIGNPIEITDRTIYPVIQISILKTNNGNAKGAWIVPVAIVVEEDLEMFLIRLNDESIDFERLFRLVDCYKSKNR
jgi:uncharacterized spore protein YtfJ